MRQRTLYNELFAEAIAKISEGKTNEQMGRLADISPETIRRMRNGRVPTKENLEKLIAAFPEIDREELMVAAGYEMPSNPVERIRMSLEGSMFNDEAKQQILDFAKEVYDNYKK